MKKINIFLVMVLVQAVLVCPETRAATNAISFTSALQDLDTNDTFGFRFTVCDQPLSVTALGFWDENGDGLNESYPVAIYDVATEQILISTIVPSGTAGDLVDGFRYAPVSPTWLAADTTYVILAYRLSGLDPVAYDVTSLSTPLPITYETQVGITQSGGLVFNNTPTPGITSGWFGPNFQANVVPEPGTIALLLLGGTCLLVRRLRRS